MGSKTTTTTPRKTWCICGAKEGLSDGPVYCQECKSFTHPAHGIHQTRKPEELDGS
jgi:hypothetical protein